MRTSTQRTRGRNHFVPGGSERFLDLPATLFREIMKGVSNAKLIALLQNSVARSCFYSAGITGRSIFVGFMLTSGDCLDYRQCASPEFGRKAEYLLDKAASFRGGEISDALICLGRDSRALP